jgi:hypothetical protein
MAAKLVEAYQNLRDAGQAKPEYDQVKTLLEKVRIETAQVEIVKAHVRQNFRSNMTGGIEYLSTEFAWMFPQATFQSTRRHGRNIHAAGSDDKQQRTYYQSYQAQQRHHHILRC